MQILGGMTDLLLPCKLRIAVSRALGADG